MRRLSRRSSAGRRMVGKRAWRVRSVDFAGARFGGFEMFAAVEKVVRSSVRKDLVVGREG